MKIPLQLSPTKNCNFLQRSSETTNPDKYTEKKPISDNLTKPMGMCTGNFQT